MEEHLLTIYLLVQAVSPGQVLQSITSAYDAWKQFIPEVILPSIVKYTTEEAHRKGDTNFSLSLNELEAFIALQYARGLYGKNTHFFSL